LPVYIDDEEEEFDYYPEDCVFKNMAAIPQVLLLEVIELYGQAKEHCKWCFYIRSKNVRPLSLLSILCFHSA